MKSIKYNMAFQMIWPLSVTYGVTQMKYRRIYIQPEVERRV